MAGLAGFSDNPFRDRSDLVRAAAALIQPLERYKSPAGARVKLYPSTAAGFDDVAAQLEGFARPLWAIATMLNEDSSQDLGELQSWIRGLKAGVDPQSPEYWGSLGSFDQRMVEMESIAFALLTAPEAMLGSLDSVSKTNLGNWLQQINNFTMPTNNWRWFRVLVNLALVKVLGFDKSKARQVMDDDFAALDQFYIGEGWSSDGVWGDERKQADYYSGSFAIQFAQLLYIRHAEDDEERVERYRQQATEFASQYWRYFDTNGAAIPFGRSMTYRFACGAFWAALAIVDVQLPNPVGSLGSIKGMLLRHLRWWSKQTEIFNADGTMTIGFTYPNMYMSEDYNSRQSVYWCLKSFIVLGLPADHPFWTCEEESHPMETSSLSSTQIIWPPRHILCNSPEHHYLLSSGQMTTKKFKAREAKYAKFAYSSAFGFSVPTGLELHQLAPDSTLTISLDDGDSWKVRWEPFDVRTGTAVLITKEGLEVPTLVSTWKPFSYLSLEIETTLIPLSPYFPGWHVRLHKVRGFDCLVSVPWCRNIQLIDTSFAIPALSKTGYHVPEVEEAHGSISEGCFVQPASTLIKSQAGASGIINLTPGLVSEEESNGAAQAGLEIDGLLIEADPNTNLIAQRTFIPSIRFSIGPDLQNGSISTEEKENETIVLASGVFAVSSQNINLGDITEMWDKPPALQVKTGTDGKAIVQIR
ncbi:hypothetical protein FALBO_9184 [Fusarium albosuccineum]|uniref:DUF2264 domain-containing protein n=1 Tax=Fusarium albosuccineum TaxID=1237068 RepID=A0A8H4L9B7_9HYPO|nr:hypothetical protein FALBO_9184 [Fusarium albosuccineum]